MNAQAVVRTVSYITASAVLIAGVLFLTGLFLPPTVPLNIRLIMGFVMTLYGLYRVVMIRVRQQKEGGEMQSDG